MPLPKSDPVASARDYWNLPEGVRAELVNGELWDLASPSRTHQEIVIELGTRLRGFVAEHGGSCKPYVAPFAVNLFGDESTFVEPDVVVVCDRSKLSDRGCEGAPDMVVEVVSPSNSNRDYVAKLPLYRDAGVREYWVCDPQEGRTLVYVFGPDAMIDAYVFDDPVPSAVLPGFEVTFADIIAAL